MLKVLNPTRLKKFTCKNNGFSHLCFKRQQTNINFLTFLNEFLFIKSDDKWKVKIGLKMWINGNLKIFNQISKTHLLYHYYAIFSFYYYALFSLPFIQSIIHLPLVCWHESGAALAILSHSVCSPTCCTVSHFFY